MEIRAYNEMYVNDAQKILGHAIDFAVTTLNIDSDVFGSAFSVSTVSKQFERGNPRYVAGINGCELARMVLNETHISFCDIEDAMYLDKSAEYWAGWSLAFYQWYSSRSFFDILNAVPLSNIIMMYPVYHEMDIMNFTDHMTDLLKSAYPNTRLKSSRMNNGMSQSQLSNDSGVALRQIQLFEQRQRNINNAAAITLLQLSKSLNCQVEDILEYE